MTTLHDPSIASTSLIEHQVLDHVKQALRVTLDWNAPVVSMPRKLSSLQFTMKSFRRHLERVMSIEEEGGYLDEVADVKPNLQSRIESSARRSCPIPGRIRADRAAARWLERMAGRANSAASATRFASCSTTSIVHDAREIDLLQESMLMDEGGEG